MNGFFSLNHFASSCGLGSGARSLGKVENHSCHMINKDVWGYKTEIDSRNVCIGSLNFKDKK